MKTCVWPFTGHHNNSQQWRQAKGPSAGRWTDKTCSGYTAGTVPGESMLTARAVSPKHLRNERSHMQRTTYYITPRV